MAQPAADRLVTEQSLTDGAARTLVSAITAARGTGFLILGDSNYSRSFATNVRSIVDLVEAYTGGRARALGDASVSGNTAADMLARIEQVVETYQPDIMPIAPGTNDVPATSDANYYDRVTQLHDQARTLGVPVTPVVTIVPRQDQPGYLEKIARRNEWLRGFAYDTKRPLFDLFNAIVDPATGQLPGKYILVPDDSTIHLNSAGRGLVAAYIAEQLTTLLPPISPLRATSNVDPLNLIDNGFLINEDVNGLPVGWTASGGAVNAVETLAPEPGFRGQAWRCSIAANDTPFRKQQTLITDIPPTGSVVEFQMKVKVHADSGLEKGEGVGMSVIFDGATSGAVAQPLQGVAGAPGAVGLHRARLTVPLGPVTGIYVEPNFVAPTGRVLDASIGEVAAFNISALPA